jgi:predicted DsbA family dithiol-disulfide isomerase
VRLGRIQELYADAVSVSWRSFLLRPRPEPRTLEQFRRYTESWSRPASQADGGRFRAWSTDEPPPSHSLPPNIAVKAAARQGEGAFDRYHLALMDAYFWDNRCPTDASTLIDVARAVGLDVACFEADFHDVETARQVVSQYKDAIARGVGAVPTVAIDDEWQIPGAQDLEFYRRLIDKRLAASAQGGRT